MHRRGEGLFNDLAGSPAADYFAVLSLYHPAADFFAVISLYHP